VSLILCNCDRGYHLAGDGNCPDAARFSQPLKTIAWGVALSLPLWGLIYAVLKLAGVL